MGGMGGGSSIQLYHLWYYSESCETTIKETTIKEYASFIISYLSQLWSSDRLSLYKGENGDIDKCSSDLVNQWEQREYE